MVIALLGPDGSGKSTLIARLEEELEAMGIVVQIMHFRVQWKKAGVAVTNPYGRLPHPFFVSVAKVLVWVIQYNLWQWTRRLWSPKQSIVLFDRFLFDVRVDPRRYRVDRRAARIPLELLVLPRPSPVFVLDVPALELQRRKSEVTTEESEAQAAAYRVFASENPTAIVLDASQPIDDLVKIVIQVLRDCDAFKR